jgi:hypothetical protein
MEAVHGAVASAAAGDLMKLSTSIALGFTLALLAARSAHATLYAGYGTALLLGGTDHYQYQPSKTFNPNSVSFTAELWFKPQSNAGTQVLLSQLAGTGTGRTWLFMKNGALATDLGGRELLGKMTISAATWHHAAVVYDRAFHRVTLYLDGTVQAVGTTWAESATGALVFGASNSYSQNFTGAIDEARLWSRRHSTQQIRKDMNLVLHGNETGLTSYLQWNDGATAQRTADVKTGFSTQCWSGSVSGYLPAVDTAGDSITYAITSQGSLGTVTVDSSGKFTYTQTAGGTTGTDTFGYSVTAGDSTQTASVTVSVGKLDLAFTELTSTSSPVHGLAYGSSTTYLTFADLDSDNDLDLFTWVALGGVNYYKNAGSSTSASFVSATSPLPAQTWCLDGTVTDGCTDNGQQVNCCNYSGGGQITETTYESGSPYLSMAFYDNDNDGDLDAIASHKGKSPSFYVYTNGSATSPSFSTTGAAWINTTNNFNGFDFNNYSNMSFGDLVMNGYPNGILTLTTGTTSGNSNPKPLAQAANFLDEFSIPAASSDPLQNSFVVSNNFFPTISSAVGDLDGDGDYDVVLSGFSGGLCIQIYLNAGSNESPSFSSASTSLGDDSGFCSVAVADLDGDGDLDLIMGRYGQEIRYYRNDTALASP